MAVGFDELDLNSGSFTTSRYLSPITQQYEIAVAGYSPAILSNDIIKIYDCNNPRLALIEFIEKNSVNFIKSVLEFVVTYVYIVIYIPIFSSYFLS